MSGVVCCSENGRLKDKVWTLYCASCISATFSTFPKQTCIKGKLAAKTLSASWFFSPLSSVRVSSRKPNQTVRRCFTAGAALLPSAHRVFWFVFWVFFHPSAATAHDFTPQPVWEPNTAASCCSGEQAVVVAAAVGSHGSSSKQQQ